MALADDGAVGAPGQVAHAGTSSARLGPELAQRVAEHRGAVAPRWRGGRRSACPRRPATTAAASTVSRFHGRPSRALPRSRGPGSGWPRRHRGRSAARVTVAVGHVEGEPDGHAGDVVVATLGDLVERRQRGAAGAASGHRPDQLAGRSTVCAVAGEVVGQRHLALTLGGGQHEHRVEREQRGREVADRRRRAEVATDRGAVADQPRRELRPHLVEQRHRAVQAGARPRTA